MLQVTPETFSPTLCAEPRRKPFLSNRLEEFHRLGSRGPAVASKSRRESAGRSAEMLERPTGSKRHGKRSVATSAAAGKNESVPSGVIPKESAERETSGCYFKTGKFLAIIR